MDALKQEDGESLNVIEENIEALKAIFPDAFTEDGVNFEALRQLLGDQVADGEEKYGLTWHGKKKARQIALTPSTGTLRPCPEESADWDTTQNLFIEGDNLEVLKLLQKSYAGKIKLIYIDPPYNTGKEFIYPDKYQENLDTYLKYTGQKSDDGLSFSSNSETSGRYHTNWLSMMYPRIKAARGLLSNDGVMVVSIDNNEVANLKRLIDEVFGEENILAIVANVNNPKGRSDDKYFATSHEYLIFAAKSISDVVTFGFEPEEKITKRYNKVDDGGKKYREIDLRKTGDADRRVDRPDMFYYFYYDEKSRKLSVSKTKREHQGEREIFPVREDGVEGRWRWGFDTAQKNIDQLIARLMPNRGIWGVFEKDLLEGRPPVKPTTSWTFKDVNSERGSEQFVALGFDKEVFPRPKPLGTLKRVIEITTIPDEEVNILDFFAGSATIAQAAMQLDAEGKRKLNWIAVQLPEQLSPENKEQKAGYDFCKKAGLPENIASIGKERIRRAAEKIRTDHVEYDGDLGFKVFKLDSSNIRAWNPDAADLEKSLLDHAEHLVEGRSEQDVLYELLLKRGVDLTVPIEEKKIAGKTVYSIGFGVLFACLDDNIAKDEIESLAQGITAWHSELEPASDTQVVFRDSAFADDIAKTNMTAILEQNGIAHVRSL